jgi:hypothetical protein
MEDDVENIDLSTLNDARADNKRKYPGEKPFRQSKQADVDPEHEPDPDWIEFDPEKETGKFFGHVMVDEEKLREKVHADKEKRKAREEDKKKKAIDSAKRAAQQRLDQLKQDDQMDTQEYEKAKLFSEQIEENYSKFDTEFETQRTKGGYKNETETLSDD